MGTVTACDVPADSLLAAFGGQGGEKAQDYRDCFMREVPDVEGRAVSLAQFIERFYCSRAFRPERIVLGLIGYGATDADAAALARGEADGIAVWKVVKRTETEALLEAKSTGTASWFKVEPLAQGGTRLYFGSWVGGIERSRWRAMLRAHVWYSRVLLGGV